MDTNERSNLLLEVVGSSDVKLEMPVNKKFIRQSSPMK